MYTIYAISADCAVPIAWQGATLMEARSIAWECYMHDQASGNIRPEALDYQVHEWRQDDEYTGEEIQVLHYSAARDGAPKGT